MKFYDIHCHAFNLNHLHFKSFIQRLNRDFSPAGNMLPRLITSVLSTNKSKRIENMLSLMDNDIGNYFLIMEYFLKDKEKGILNKGFLQIGSHIYEKIVLVPLIIDFGFKNYSINNYYNIPSKRPIMRQTAELLNGIKKYSQNEIILTRKTAFDNSKTYRYHYEYQSAAKSEKLFEIYPFLGINTMNYVDVEDLNNKVLDKFFKNVISESSEERQRKLYKAMGKFPGSFEEKRFDYSYLFAGIKLYPPLGFDPWPEHDAGLQKVKRLYQVCSQKQIPITVHCSQRGFTTLKKDLAEKLTDPDRWKPVIESYPQLKINFSHLGAEQLSWREKIISYINDNEKNVYSDIANQAVNKKYYNKLKNILNKYSSERLNQRLLFGSDFMMNLTKVKSYNEYISYFKKTNKITLSEKNMMCNKNPERFLFGISNKGES